MILVALGLACASSGPIVQPAITNTPELYAFLGLRMVGDIFPDGGSLGGLYSGLRAVFAYTADYLSYYQDAVATEAYLDTARQRISVRRHVRRRQDAHG